MADNVRLNEAELAALDVLIEAKRNDPQLLNEYAFLPKTTPAILVATRLITRVTPTITRLTVLTIDLIGPVIDKTVQASTLKQMKKAGKGLSVDDLISARKDAGGK